MKHAREKLLPAFAERQFAALADSQHGIFLRGASKASCYLRNPAWLNSLIHPFKGGQASVMRILGVTEPLGRWRSRRYTACSADTWTTANRPRLGMVGT